MTIKPGGGCWDGSQQPISTTSPFFLYREPAYCRVAVQPGPGVAARDQQPIPHSRGKAYFFADNQQPIPHSRGKAYFFADHQQPIPHSRGKANFFADQPGSGVAARDQQPGPHSWGRTDISLIKCAAPSQPVRGTLCSIAASHRAACCPARDYDSVSNTSMQSATVTYSCQECGGHHERLY
jgi:hypothetical protein